ncbi:hypothetical protein [Bradyrhizobium icense]|uniref:Uncharacterized protein n=1 Tax=Bradyrhizobium icense TaxID=1274631 RepID=A0A1B1UHN2_9BRAD|nr:hypothetical protein [Bradyrhizobium icense]ANW02250.1 hypothetical protein LMTR13_20840 [Bradyrhizobium icense]
MSEAEASRDDAGRFTKGAANLTGEAAANASMGYTTREDPVEKGPEDAKELAASIAELRGEPEVPEAAEEPVEQDPDAPKEALTQRQLVDELADRRLMHEIDVERRGHEEVAAWADSLREHILGTEKPAAIEPVEPAAKEAEAAPTEPTSGLDPKLEEALKHPQVREAVEAELKTASQSREAYTAGLENARVYALASLGEVVPHLAGLPPLQFEQGLAVLSQIDPPAFQSAMNILGRVHAITQAQQQHQQQRSYAEHQDLRTFKAAEDAKLAESLGAERGLVQQYQSKVEPYLKSLGMRPDEMQALANDRTVNSALGQRVLLDAMRYREIMNAPKSFPARDIPSVQRPGVSASSAERQASSLNAKTARARANIDSGRGGAKDLGSLIASMRRA